MSQEIYKKLNRSIEINGQTIKVVVEVHVEEDFDFPLENACACGDDKCDVIPSLKRGDTFVATIFVKASALSSDGYDSLSGCVVPCNNMFNSKPFEREVNSLIKDHGMVKIALEDLKKNILERAKTLAPFFLGLSR